MRTVQRPRRGRLVASAAAAALALALAGCAQSSGNDGDVLDQGYQSGDGSVRTWAATDRSDPVTLKGDDYAGDPVDTSQWRGDVVVVNTWYAACPPCRQEAPHLVETANDYEGSVHFVGINTTDEAGAAQAFERTFDVPYPSIEDTDGAVIATLQGVVPIQAVPTTVIIDQEGRVAARVLGEVEESTLRTLLDDVVAQGTTQGATTGATQGTGPDTSTSPSSSTSSSDTTS